jgi:serine/threonine protein kinase
MDALVIPSGRPPDPDPEGDGWDIFKNVLRYLSLSQISERYTTNAIISQNRNATIRLSTHTITGQQVGIKIMDKSKAIHERHLLFREIQTLKALGNAKHISELYDVIDSGDRIWIVIEYASGGELFDFIRAKAPLPESLTRDIFRPIVKVVSFMHSKGLVHRDLKLENVLLGQNGRIVLADFGFSRFYDPAQGLVDSVCGTAHYSPPEVVRGAPYDPILGDSWSLGIILYVMLFNEFPFRGISIPEMLQEILKGQYTIPRKISAKCRDLLTHLITLNPADRLTSADILQHPWMAKPKLPRLSKQTQIERVSKAAQLEIRRLGFIGEIPEEKMEPDHQIAYRLVRRKYQLRLEPIPQLLAGSSRMRFSSTSLPVAGILNLNPVKVIDRTCVSRVFPTGLDSGTVRTRLPRLDQFLHISKCRYRHSISVAADVKPYGDVRQRDIRKEQAMRFRTTLNEMELPTLNCEHTTLDPPELLFEKLISFIAKDEGASIISERDFSLFCRISQPSEVDFSVTIGCVHEGFQLIGLAVTKIRGDERSFKELEQRLTDFLGF